MFSKPGIHACPHTTIQTTEVQNLHQKMRFKISLLLKGVVVPVMKTAQSWIPGFVTTNAGVAVCETSPDSGSEKRFEAIAVRITGLGCFTDTLARLAKVSYEIVPTSCTSWKMLKWVSHGRRATYCSWMH